MKINRYFVANTVIGSFFAITNGGASMMMLANSSSWSKGQITEAVLLSLIGLVVAIIGIAAITKTISEKVALSWQFLIITVLVLFLTIWGIGLLLQTTSQDIKISWLAGFLTALAVYVYFLSKQVTGSRIAGFITKHWLPLFIVILCVDFSLFFKIVNIF